MEQQNITAVKGIGEKTAKLFQKIGVETVEELLHYYPRAYDEFKEPQPIAELKEDTIAAVSGILAKTADVVRYGARLQVTTAGLRDSGGTLALAWYNMPYLRGTLKAGGTLYFPWPCDKKTGKTYDGAAGDLPPGTVCESRVVYAAGLRTDEGTWQ